MLRIDLCRQAQKFVQSPASKQARQVTDRITALRRDPAPADSRSLKGHPYRRVDIGEYRIVDRVEGDTLYVHLVGQCNDAEVYRLLRRRE